MTGDRPPSPPGLPRALLRLSLGRDAYEIVAGDLDEGFHADAARFGSGAARRRYWRQAIASIGAYWRPAADPRPAPTPTPRGTMMETLVQDLKSGLRQVRHRPGFTVAIAGTLAVGIAATATVFGLVNALVLRPLPYANPSQVVFLLGWDTREDRMRFNVRYGDAVDLAAQVDALDSVAVYRGWDANLTGSGLPELAQGYRVSPNTFELLGTGAAQGRTFVEADVADGTSRLVVLSHGLWARRFGGDPTMVGKTIAIDGADHVVTGVMPADFEFPVFNFKGDLWAPLIASPEWTPAAREQSPSVVAIARLGAGSSLEQAQEQASAVMAQVARDHPDNYADIGVRVTPMAALGAEQAAPAFVVLGLAVWLLLLVACANAANLQFARSLARGREIAVRAALGASRARLMRQFVIESSIIALAGGVLGAGLTWLALDRLRKALPDFILRVAPGAAQIRLDADVLIFAMLVSLGTVLFFGLLPAWRIARPGLADALRSGGRTTGDSVRHRLRSGLVVGEVAVSVVLLVTTLLLARSAGNLSRTDPGFDKERLLAFSLSLPQNRYADAPAREALFNRVAERLEAYPGVTRVGLVNRLPFSTSNETTRFRIDGLERPDGQPFRAGLRFVNDGYVEALGLRIVQGRGLDRGDGTGLRPVVVNEAFVREVLRDQPVLGRSFRFDADTDNPRPIVGVVSDVLHWSLSDAAEPEVYAHFAQAPAATMTFALRTDGEPAALVPSIRAEVAALEPSLPIFNVAPMDRMVRDSYLAQEMASVSLVVFGVSSLALTALGLHGLLAFVVGLRRQEIGIRVALGATRRAVGGMVVRQSLWLTAVGLVIGLGLAMAASQGLGSFLFGVSPLDAASYAGAALVIGAVAIVASWLPARRALAVDPVTTLRD